MNIFLDNFSSVLFYLNSSLGILLFIFIYVISVIFILPASWLSILAGFLYGTFVGSIVVFIAAFIGASISFFISRNFLAKRVNSLINKFSKLDLLENIVQKGGLKLIILTRLSPLFPFSLLNYFYGLNKIEYRKFSISLIFIAPGTFLYCSLGNLAKSLNELRDLRISNNFIMTSIGVISTFLIVYFLAKYANEFINENNIN